MDTAKLTKIIIKGYKSISSASPITLDLNGIDVLLGANGAGKSNIISFFQMLVNMMKGGFQKYVAESGSNKFFLHYGAKQTSEINAELWFGNLKYSFSLANAVNERLIITNEEIATGNRNAKRLVSDFQESALSNCESAEAKKIKNYLLNCKVYQFHDSSVTSAMRQRSETETAHYLQSDAGNLASFLFFLQHNYQNSYNRIVDYVKSVIPQFRDFYLEPAKNLVSLNWTDTSLNDYVLSPYQFSDGSIRFIALAALLLQPAETMPTLVIIDEPELGLHPYAVGQLVEMVKDASTHTQIILATQSPELINGFDIENISVIERDEDKQCTIVKRLNGSDYSEWLEDYTIGELWNKNVLGGRPL